MNYVISISGSSGVGKTTLAHLLAMALGDEDCLCISGDDLHKWERTDPMWMQYTHLNPDANDLEMGIDHIHKLKRGSSVSRKRYNHDTGKFDADVELQPKPYIVFEGLHTMYLKESREQSDINIFVDTDEELKVDWKVKRDTKKRGYTRDQVMETVLRRKSDEQKFILPQKNYADIIVKFAKSRDYKIRLDYVCMSEKGKELMDAVSCIYDSMKDFTDVCKWLSLEPSLVQDRGGNVSCKTGNSIIITASGSKMGEITFNHGYSVCRIPDVCDFESEQQYREHIRSTVVFGNHNPSMESGFHMKIPSRVVVHTHPLHLNCVLCSEQCADILQTLFSDIAFEFVEYTTPGFELCNRITGKCNVVFLQNHGLIVGAETADESYEITERINNRCKRWISNHVDSFVDDGISVDGGTLFPDAAVFPKECSAINSYILHMIREIGLTPVYLTQSEQTKLNSMDSEKHRKMMS
jgi:uridine kinase/ribulose-5-phosphate 4-epimerase/fuculose-1-phosphate aldolase